MSEPLPLLPLPLTALPEGVRRFVDPAAPAAARTMAAKGLLPLQGADLVTVLAQLSADAAPDVAKIARETLGKQPEAVLKQALGHAIHAAILDRLSDVKWQDQALLSELVTHPDVHDDTLARIARTADRDVCERIAVNEARMLRAPRVVEALYYGKALGSTKVRLVDLCVRNGVDVPGLPEGFVESLQGELIPEPEPGVTLPDDALLDDAITSDPNDHDVVEEIDEDGTEKVKEKVLPLSMKINGMATFQKLMLASTGGAAARALLVRDKEKNVALAALRSPQMTDEEAAAIARSKEVGDHVMREIGRQKKWHGNYNLKRNLVMNPKTPAGLALQFVAHLREADLRSLAKSRGVPQAIKAAALQRIIKTEKK